MYVLLRPLFIKIVQKEVYCSWLHRSTYQVNARIISWTCHKKIVSAFECPGFCTKFVCTSFLLNIIRIPESMVWSFLERILHDKCVWSYNLPKKFLIKTNSYWWGSNFLFACFLWSSIPTSELTHIYSKTPSSNALSFLNNACL